MDIISFGSSDFQNSVLMLCQKIQKVNPTVKLNFKYLYPVCYLFIRLSKLHWLWVLVRDEESFLCPDWIKRTHVENLRLLHFILLLVPWRDMCVRVCVLCLHVCICMMHMPGDFMGQKRLSNCLELELRVVVNQHVDAGNWIQILWKNECV